MSKFQTFEDYWKNSWIPSGMPAVFDEAMKEIAFKAWNGGLDVATSVVNQYSDQNEAMDILGDLKYNPDYAKQEQILDNEIEKRYARKTLGQCES